MQPGTELDALVARVMGWRWLACKPMDSSAGPLVRFIASPNINYRAQIATGNEVRASDWDKTLPHFSADPAAAMEAWAWLEEHNPWEHNREGKADLMLGRYGDDSKPAVFIMAERWEYYPEAYNGGYSGKLPNMAISGTTYPHAIALAIVEAGKALGVIE